MERRYDDIFDLKLESFAGDLSCVRDAIRYNDLHVLLADACPHANGEDFMHQASATEYNRERFYQVLKEAWGDEANLVQESTLRELVPEGLPSGSKKKRLCAF